MLQSIEKNNNLKKKKEYIVADITALSTKGQIVLPKSIRNELNLEIGTKFIVIVDGENILLKPIKAPDPSEFNYLMNKAQEWANSMGIKQKDVDEIVNNARKRVKK